MPLSNRRTLTQYLIEQRSRFPQASGALNALILDVALAAKAIARSVAFGGLGDPMSRPLAAAAQSDARVNVQGEVQMPLDVISNETYERNGYPHEAWTQLRRQSPVHRFAPEGVRPFWAVTKHADQISALGGVTACQPCHGTDYRGTVLSRTFVARTLAGKTFTDSGNASCQPRQP